MTTPSMTDKQSVRWWSYVLTTDGCWHWTSYTNQKGYGRFSLNGKLFSAHRIAYEILIGPIPDGMEIDHLCKNRACVNPNHLEAVDHKTNVLRGENFSARFARRTHCSRCGLALAGDNLLVRKENGFVSRRCLGCKRSYGRVTSLRMRAKKKGA